MTDRSYARRVFQAGALANVLVTVPAIISPTSVERAFGVRTSMPFLIRLWAAYAFVWGVIFAEIGADPDNTEPMMKWATIEKAVTSAVVLAAVSRRMAPRRLAPFILLTDVVWIPLFMSAHLRYLRAASR